MLKNVVKKDRGKRRLTDLIGVDFSTTATKVVRLKSAKGAYSLAGLDLLPPVDFKETAKRIELPRNMSTYYGCLAYTAPSAVVRIVNTPLAANEEMVPDSKLRELLNVTNDYRIFANLIRRGKGRQDSSLLAAAIPNDDARFLINMFPSGPPAPASLEISGLAFVSAFLNARSLECAEKAVCLLEAGETITHFVFLNKCEVVLVGKMPFGAASLRKKLASDLGVDDDLAANILSDRSINISSSLGSVMDPFIKQISISKDFIERHLGCKVPEIYVSGGLSMLHSWTNEVGNMLNAEAKRWSPFENIECDPEILSEEMKAQAPRFAAVMGAAIGGLSE